MPRTFHSAAYVAFVEQLVAARRAAGLTQAELAKRLGRHQSFVSNYEGRIRRLDVIETVIIARTLGITVGDILAELEASVGADLHI